MKSQVIARFLEAKDQPPSQLIALVRRSFTGHPTYKFYPGTEEPHLFTFPVASFSVNMTDLKILLRKGMTRIQSNDSSKITVYFGPTADEAPLSAPPVPKSKQDWHNVDWFSMGREAFKLGLPAKPTMDQRLMQKIESYGHFPIGEGPATLAFKEWQRGWTRANLDEPVA